MRGFSIDKRAIFLSIKSRLERERERGIRLLKTRVESLLRVLKAETLIEHNSKYFARKENDTIQIQN